MKDDLYKIGEVATLFNVSVQTLRFYEKIGLFVPATIEKSTGYRYYSWEQFERLRNILFLRDFGLSLKDIKHQLDVEHSAVYKSLLEEYSQTLERRIREDIQLKKYIDRKIENLELARYLPKNETLFLLFPSLKVLKHDCVIGSRATFKDMQLTIASLISEYHLKAGIESVGQYFKPDALTDELGGLVTRGIFITEEVFTSDTYSIAEEHITTIPKGVYGVMYYQSSTNQSLPFVKKLLSDIRRQSLQPCGDIIRTIVFDLGRGKPTKDGYLACMRVLVKEANGA